METTEPAQHRSIDAVAIAKKHRLTIVPDLHPLGKSFVHLLQDKEGNRYFLKTEQTPPEQPALFRLARQMEDQLSFTAPEVIDAGNGWILTRFVEGEHLHTVFDAEPDRVIKMTYRIAHDYQQVIQAFHPEPPTAAQLQEAVGAIQEQVQQWSKPLIERGWMQQSEVDALSQDFQQHINTVGADTLFGWAHGNVIGEHVMLTADTPVLLDLEIELRPGKGYYDFLRALDWLLLKAAHTAEQYDRFPAWIAQYLGDRHQEEVRMIFALRCMGVIGHDMLRNKDAGAGDTDEKIQQLLRFLRLFLGGVS